MTESWLTSEDSSANEKLAGISDAELLADLPYTCYRTDQADGRKGGGVLLVVKNSCMTSRRCDLERATLEMVVTEIQLANSTNVIAAVFYRPPDSSDRFFDKFEAFLNSVETTEGNKKLLILGDFNLPKIDSKNLTTCFPTELNFCETFYLAQMVLSPTRITDESQSILDLVITNNPDNVLNLHIVNPLDMQFS